MTSVRQRNSTDDRSPPVRNDSSHASNGHVAGGSHGAMRTKAHLEAGGAHERGSALANALNLFFCASGILVCYFYFGIAQESMYVAQKRPVF